jgi:hypothetical protein
MAVQIQFRRGTAAAWTAADTVLAEGELGLETDTALFKIGDGTTAWTSLGYGGFDGTATLTQIGISSGTDIGAALADADEIAVYDDSASSNKKADVSRIKTYVFSAVDAKGDLLAGTAADTVARVAVGSNNTVLMADSAQAAGLKYASEATATLTTTGDVLYASAANTLARLGIGSSGQALVVSDGVPSWGNVASSGESDQVTLAVQVFS